LIPPGSGSYAARRLRPVDDGRGGPGIRLQLNRRNPGTRRTAPASGTLCHPIPDNLMARSDGSFSQGRHDRSGRAKLGTVGGAMSARLGPPRQ